MFCIGEMGHIEKFCVLNFAFGCRHQKEFGDFVIDFVFFFSPLCSASTWTVRSIREVLIAVNALLGVSHRGEFFEGFIVW